MLGLNEGGLTELWCGWAYLMSVEVLHWFCTEVLTFLPRMRMSGTDWIGSLH